jgi:hypothetical protein
VWLDRSETESIGCAGVLCARQLNGDKILATEAVNVEYSGGNPGHKCLPEWDFWSLPISGDCRRRRDRRRHGHHHAHRPRGIRPRDIRRDSRLSGTI